MEPLRRGRYIGGVHAVPLRGTDSSTLLGTGPKGKQSVTMSHACMYVYRPRSLAAHPTGHGLPTVAEEEDLPVRRVWLAVSADASPAGGHAQAG